ncbi:MAG: hypothetical protein ACXW6K_19150 [Candidatus Binatia bacterium]
MRHAAVLLTMVGGKVVYVAAPFDRLAPPPLPVSPDWSPVKNYGGHWRSGSPATAAARTSHMIASAKLAAEGSCATSQDMASPWWFGCGCFV